MADSLGVKLEKQFHGFKSCFGGEELKRATSALAGGIDMPPIDGGKEAKMIPSDANIRPIRTSLSGVTTAVLAQTSHPDASESDLVLRELALAANQYQKAEAAAGPSGQDFETLYNHGLVLQEMAGKLHSSPADQLKLLQQASELYGSAAALRPSSHNVLYNWGVALSDTARLLQESQPAESLSCLQQASHKYASSLDLQPGNPQALNNWGLVLQEMCGLAHSVSERDQLVSYALEKFRHAIRLRPDFDRGCYNLGTVLYTYACAVQAELAAELKAGRLASQDAETTRERYQREARARCLFSAAAQYICLAATLQPGRDIYRRSLAVVKPMLPLPFLRAGYLTAPLAHSLGSPNETWRRAWFVLDQVSLRSASEMESSLSATATGALPGSFPTLRIGHAVGETPLVVPLDSILSVRRVNDPSLPEGEALWLQLSHPLGTSSISSSSTSHAATAGGGGGVSGAQPSSFAHPSSRSSRDRDRHTDRAAASEAGFAASVATQPTGLLGGREENGCGSGSGGGLAPLACAPPRLCVWLVADDADSADAWADALLLAGHIVRSRSPAALEEALTPGGGGAGGAGGAVGGNEGVAGG
ncbi:hypothetical protein PLESTF_000101200 [Pleodorina starrii]|nr:hypothetical protein PLESTM_001266900 [Pleodorina starrii]GLC63942.1 hypothetical protein PLESTF_000101200 [Pleodorina starrii]